MKRMALLAGLVFCGHAYAAETSNDWAWASTYTHQRGDDRVAQSRLDIELHRALSPTTHLEIGLQARHRRGDTDETLIVGLSHYPDPRVRLYGAVGATPDPDFTYSRMAKLGVEWRAAAQLGLGAEVRHFDFGSRAGSLRELRSSATFFSKDDDTRLTATYTDGSGSGSRGYSGWSMNLEHDLDRQRRISVVHARGLDPEFDPSIAWRDRNMTGAYYRFPWRSTRMDAIVGAEHEQVKGLGSSNGIVVGLAGRF